MKKRAALIFVALAGVLWGTSAIFVHYLAPLGFSPIQMTGVRAAVSFIAMVTVALIKDRKLFAVKPRECLLFAAIGVSLFATATLYYSAIGYSGAPTAVTLMYTAPLYVAVFGALVFREKFSRAKVISIALMLIGCALVSGIVGGLGLNPVGLLLGALSGISYAAYNILTKISLKRGNAPITATLYSFLFMSVISLFLSNPIGTVQTVSEDPMISIPLLLGLGIFTFVMPYFLYTLGMRELPASVATTLGIIEPLAATLFSIILFSARVDAFIILGIILILISAVILGRED